MTITFVSIHLTAQCISQALRAGAYGCSISGAGPTVFAIADDV